MVVLQKAIPDSVAFLDFLIDEIEEEHNDQQPPTKPKISNITIPAPSASKHSPTPSKLMLSPRQATSSSSNAEHLHVHDMPELPIKLQSSVCSTSLSPRAPATSSNINPDSHTIDYQPPIPLPELAPKSPQKPPRPPRPPRTRAAEEPLLDVQPEQSLEQNEVLQMDGTLEASSEEESFAEGESENVVYDTSTIEPSSEGLVNDSDNIVVGGRKLEKCASAPINGFITGGKKQVCI